MYNIDTSPKKFNKKVLNPATADHYFMWATDNNGLFVRSIYGQRTIADYLCAPFMGNGQQRTICVLHLWATDNNGLFVCFGYLWATDNTDFFCVLHL
jgi:hypothetical protein